MHNFSGTYQSFIDPEIQQVCHFLSPAFEPDAMHSFLADNHPEKIYNILLRHRLYPSFYRKWTDVCDKAALSQEWVQFTQQLRRKADTNRMQMLQKTNTLLGIADAFAHASIPMIPLKGPVLAYQLFGDVGMKASLDLDILIPQSHFDHAWETLETLGYRTEFNYKLSPRQRNYLLNNFHHLAFINGNIRIELHWEINTNRYMTGRPNEEYFREAITINIAGKTIQTLHPDHLTEYLSIHGSYHAWNRLDWLYDFSHAMATHHESLPRLSDHMQRAGLGMIFNQSMILSNILFSANLKDITPTVPNSLICIPLAEMGKSYSEAKHRGLSRITQKLYLLKLKKNWKYRIHVFSVLGTNQGNWQRLKLPDRFFFLYFLLRPVLYLIQTLPKPQSPKN
ncbi:MAG TPA: nucleotidyltransferase family protein [Bacteroidales bacterium]|nr:nucleotidyltransferase family protein [Bacteroidales bacterium]